MIEYFFPDPRAALIISITLNVLGCLLAGKIGFHVIRGAVRGRRRGQRRRLRELSHQIMLEELARVQAGTESRPDVPAMTNTQNDLIDDVLRRSADNNAAYVNGGVKVQPTKTLKGVAEFAGENCSNSEPPSPVKISTKRKLRVNPIRTEVLDEDE